MGRRPAHEALTAQGGTTLLGLWPSLQTRIILQPHTRWNNAIATPAGTTPTVHTSRGTETQHSHHSVELVSHCSIPCNNDRVCLTSLCPSNLQHVNIKYTVCFLHWSTSFCGSKLCCDWLLLLLFLSFVSCVFYNFCLFFISILFTLNLELIVL